jgi:hypothetical protein
MGGMKVFKVGSSSLSTNDGKFALGVICGLVEAIVSLRKKGYKFVYVPFPFFTLTHSLTHSPIHVPQC